MPFKRKKDERSYRREKYKLDSSIKKKALIRYKRNILKLKNKIFQILGNKCTYCGFSDQRALQIDHIRNNGYRERLKRYSVTRYYKKIIKSGGKGYQILCANCNWIKRIENLGK